MISSYQTHKCDLPSPGGQRPEQDGNSSSQHFQGISCAGSRPIPGRPPAGGGSCLARDQMCMCAQCARFGAGWAIQNHKECITLSISHSRLCQPFPPSPGRSAYGLARAVVYRISYTTRPDRAGRDRFRPAARRDRSSSLTRRPGIDPSRARGVAAVHVARPVWSGRTNGVIALAARCGQAGRRVWSR